MLPIVAVASLIAQGLTDASPIEGVLSALGAVFQTGVQIAFWVTVVSPSWSARTLPCRRGNGHLRTCLRSCTAASGWGDRVRNQRADPADLGALLAARSLAGDHRRGVAPVLAPAAWSPWLVAAAGDPAGDGGPGDRQVPHWSVDGAAGHLEHRSQPRIRLDRGGALGAGIAALARHSRSGPRWSSEPGALDRCRHHRLRHRRGLVESAAGSSAGE